MGGRHFYLARELAKQGHRVYVIASASHHLLRNQPIFNTPYQLEQQGDFTFVWVKMPSYTEAHSKQRALNWFIFPWRIHKLAKVIPDKPDAVLCSSPSPISFLGAQWLAKKFRARLVFEVRDIWPLTLTEIGGYSVKHPFIRLMQWVEDKAYRDADHVVSNLRNAVDHMVGRGMPKEKFTWVPNGFSLDEVNLQAPLNPGASAQLPENKFVIGYTGTLGVANALDTFIEAAELLKNHSELAFVLVGGGKEKDRLQALVVQKQLNNVHFIDPIPKVEIQAMLAKFDACYLGWLKDDLYRFGIGANKIPEYLYSGKPVVHAYSGACDPIEEAGAGVQVEAQSPHALAEGIMALYQRPVSERAALGMNGRKAALKYYEYGKLGKQLATVLLDRS